LTAPLSGVDRATLLITLGEYTRELTLDNDGSRSIGEQAAGLTEGSETPAMLLARAKAQVLIWSCVWKKEPALATAIAESTLLLFDQVKKSAPSLEPEDLWEISFDSAELNSTLGQFDIASWQAEQAVLSAPDRNQELNSLCQLGAIYRLAGRIVESREILTRAIRLADVPAFTLVPSYYELALTESALGKAAEARAKIRRAIDILQSDPTPPSHHLPDFLRFYADISYEMDDIEEAMGSFQAASDAYPTSDPEHWGCLLWVASLQFTQGDLDSASVNAERVRQSSFATVERREEAVALLAEIEKFAHREPRC